MRKKKNWTDHFLVRLTNDEAQQVISEHQNMLTLQSQSQKNGSSGKQIYKFIIWFSS